MHPNYDKTHRAINTHTHTHEETCLCMSGGPNGRLMESLIVKWAVSVLCFIFFDIKIIAGIVWDNVDDDVGSDDCCCTFAAETEDRRAKRSWRRCGPDVASTRRCRMKTYYAGNIKLHTQHLNCVCPPRYQCVCVCLCVCPCVCVCISHMLHAAQRRF